MDRAVLERAVKALADLNAKPQQDAGTASARPPVGLTVELDSAANSGKTTRIDQPEGVRSNWEWPTESEAQARRFGQSHSRLFPFIRKRVWTPAGTGILLSVFLEQCEILPDSAEKTIRVQAGDVKPIH